MLGAGVEVGNGVGVGDGAGVGLGVAAGVGAGVPMGKGPVLVPLTARVKLPVLWREYVVASMVYSPAGNVSWIREFKPS